MAANTTAATAKPTAANTTAAKPEVVATGDVSSMVPEKKMKWWMWAIAAVVAIGIIYGIYALVA